MTQLVTGEAVALNLSLAALPTRAVARAIDAAAQFAIAVALSLTAGALAGSETALQAASVVVVVATLVGYPVACETFLRGRTPGKIVMGQRAVRDDGGPIAFRQAFVRGMTIFIDLITLFVVSVVCMLLNDRNKRLGDLLAGTVVVAERVSLPTVQAPQMPPPLAGWAQGLQLALLPDELALSVRQFLSRAAGMSPAARIDLESRLIVAVAAVTAPPPPPGTPPWAYLSAVLAERRQRESARLAALYPGSGRTGTPGEQAARPSQVPSPWTGPTPAHAPRPWPSPTSPTDGFAVPF